MTRHPFADQDGELAVPAVQHVGQVGTVLAAGAGHDERTQAAVHSVAHAVHQRVALFGTDTERGSEIGALQALTHTELQDQLVAFVQSPGCAANQFTEVSGRQCLAVGVGGDGGGHLRCSQCREIGWQHSAALLGAAIDLVAQHGVQPWLQAIRFA